MDQDLRKLKESGEKHYNGGEGLVVELYLVPGEEVLQISPNVAISFDHVIRVGSIGNPIHLIVRELEAHDAYDIVFPKRKLRTRITVKHIRVQEDLINMPMVIVFFLVPYPQYFWADEGTARRGLSDFTGHVKPMIIPGGLRRVLFMANGPWRRLWAYVVLGWEYALLLGSRPIKGCSSVMNGWGYGLLCAVDLRVQPVLSKTPPCSS